MTHIIAEPCIDVKDTACVDVCPVDCIHPTKEDAAFESSEMLFIDPEEGEILGQTSADHPYLTIDVDLARADRAKNTYPRYVID